MLGLQGVRLCTAEVRCVLEICTTRPQFLHMSCFFDNEHVLHAPGEEYDVSNFNFKEVDYYLHVMMRHNVAFIKAL